MRDSLWVTIYQSDYSWLLEDRGTGLAELEIGRDFEDDKGKTRYMVYRFDLPIMAVVRQGTRDYPVTEYIAKLYHSGRLPHPIGEYEEWFAKDLARVANSVGTDRADLVRLLTDESPQSRAEAYEAIGNYHGFENLDGYPLNLTLAQFNKRWEGK